LTEVLGEGRPVRRQPLRRWGARLALVALPVAVVGEAGHQVLERLGQTLAHHFFHVVFAGLAAAIFVGYVAVDVRRHGWPTFSWRTRREDRGAPGECST
jgi:hypothetical protein